MGVMILELVARFLLKIIQQLLTFFFKISDRFGGFCAGHKFRWRNGENEQG